MTAEFRDALRKQDAAFNQYDTVVTFIRWQEAKGAISPSDAQRLLDVDEKVYIEYLQRKLPASMMLEMDFQPARTVQATEEIKRQLAETHPQLAGQVSNLGGRGTGAS